MEVFNWILVDKETKLFIWGHKSVTKPLFGNNGKETATHDKLEYIDYRKDGEPQELPEWFVDTESTPAKWNGKELVKDE